jgi:hypothetical protein
MQNNSWDTCHPEDGGFCGLKYPLPGSDTASQTASGYPRIIFLF